jgi:hypothetical protein
LQAAGYLDYGYYHYGMSRYNDSMFGWAGHTRDGNKMFADALALKHNLTLWRNLSDIVRAIMFIRNGKWENIRDIHKINALTKESRAYFTKYCFSLHSKMIPFSNIVIIPHSESEVKEIEVQLEDKNMATRRQILVNNMNNQGPLMTYQNSSKVLNLYTVELFEEVFMKDDLTKNCTEYPNDQYGSYSDCDLHYGLTRLAQEVGPGFLPLWASTNLSRVTGWPVYLDWARSPLHVNLANGFQLSDCRLPCRITKTMSKFQGSMATSQYYGISVGFKGDIQVTTTR